MIVGIGTDIVHIPRIERILSSSRKERFLQRILTDSERVAFAESAKPAEFVAGRFAAKEAGSKALGNGFCNGISYQHIFIYWAAMGKPMILFAEAAKRLADELGVRSAHVSITHEREYALAYVVLEN